MFVWSELEFAITSPSFVAPLPLVSEIAKYIARGCFTRTTLFTTMLTVIIWCVHWKVCVYQVSSWLVVVSVSYTALHVPIVMYGLRLFIVVLQELQCLPNCLHTYMVKVRGRYHSTKICCTTLSSSAKCIAWGYLMFYNNYIVYRIVYMFVWSEFGFAITSPSFVAVILLVSEMAKYITWGCLLLFYKNYIVYRIVYMFV